VIRSDFAFPFAIDARSTGVPALARVDPGVAMTVPPCGHIMTLAAVSGEGIRSPPARRC
jgi:hypothetical protein